MEFKTPPSTDWKLLAMQINTQHHHDHPVEKVDRFVITVVTVTTVVLVSLFTISPYCRVMIMIRTAHSTGRLSEWCYASIIISGLLNLFVCTNMLCNHFPIMLFSSLLNGIQME